MDSGTAAGAWAVVGTLVGVAVKSIFDLASSRRTAKATERGQDRQSETTLITEDIKGLREQLNLLREDANQSKRDWIEQSRAAVKIERDLNAAILRADKADARIEELIKAAERQRLDYEDTISEQQDKIVSLNSQVESLTTHNKLLQTQVDSLQEQVRANAQAIASEGHVPIGMLETPR